MAKEPQFPSALLSITIVACALIVLGHVLDIAMTLMILRGGGFEQSPVFAPTINAGNFMFMWVFKSLAIVAAILITTYNWRVPPRRESHAFVRRWTCIALVVAVFVVWAPVTHNLLQLL